MLNTRARGLANLHAVVITLCVGVFFWVYAQVIYLVPYIHLSRAVNLLPYFLCVVGGMILSAREIAGMASRFHLIDLAAAARLSTRQVGLMALLIFTMMFATQDHSISRAFLGSFLVWSWIGLLLLNVWVPGRLARLIFQKGHRLPTVFVGRVAAAANLRYWLARKEGLGIYPVGVLSDDAEEGSSDDLPAPLLGKSADLDQIVAQHGIAQIILLEFPPSDSEAKAIIDRCRDTGCRLLIHNNIEERYSQPLVPVTEDGRHFYTLQEEPLEDPLNRIIKRTFDLAISVPVVLFILPPLCVWVWLGQCLQSPGPLFHSRDRKGIQGKIFRMLKFRSMVPAPPDATLEAKQAETVDSRIFPFGRFLRRTSLDEFPQFWNVLIGEMSIVGPRPYMPLLDDEFRQQAQGYRMRHLVKPGITGLAQSKGLRGAVLEQEMVQRRLYWDVHYVSHWSIWLDIQITLQTLVQVVRPPKTAY